MTLPSTPTTAQDLLPQGSLAAEKALSASDARILELPVWLIRAVWDPQRCPVRLLPYLAAAWSVDEWDPAWSEAQQRQAIIDSVWIHQHKGTIGALTRAIAQLNLGATISEWFQYGGTPYTFRLTVALEQAMAWTTAQTNQLLRVAISNKNVRSFLDTVVLQSTPPPNPIYVGGVTITRAITRYVVAPVTSMSLPRGTVYIGAASYSRVTSRILPFPT